MTNPAGSDAFPVLAALEPALAARLRDFVQDREAFSPNTWRQLLSVMRSCARWSQDHGREFLPMASTDLRDYLTFLQTSGRASTTVRAHAALISMLHRHAGLVPPNASPLVFRTLRKINRTAVVAGERTGQAVPFCLSDLLAADRAWQGSAQLRDVRNLAFLHVAYGTLLRIGELARLRVRDVDRAGDGRILLHVGWTKTVVEAGGLVKALSSASTRRLEEWMAVAGLAAEPDAFLFCPVHRANRATLTIAAPLSAPALEAIFARAWDTVGPATAAAANKGRYCSWSGHSARVGAAQDMARHGYAVARIMQEGTWKKTETLMRYLRHIEAQRGAMVDMMENGGNHPPET